MASIPNVRTFWFFHPVNSLSILLLHVHSGYVGAEQYPGKGFWESREAIGTSQTQPATETRVYNVNIGIIHVLWMLFPKAPIQSNTLKPIYNKYIYSTGFQGEVNNNIPLELQK